MVSPAGEGVSRGGTTTLPAVDGGPSLGDVWRGATKSLGAPVRWPL